jgi:hypothetical protein
MSLTVTAAKKILAEIVGPNHRLQVEANPATRGEVVVDSTPCYTVADVRRIASERHVVELQKRCSERNPNTDVERADEIVAPTCNAIRSSTGGFTLCGKPHGHRGLHTAFYGGPGSGGRRPLVSWRRSPGDDSLGVDGE